MDTELRQLRDLIRGHRKQLSEGLELPEVNQILNLDERKGNEIRQYKYITQACSIQASHLNYQKLIATIAIADSYIENYSNGSAIGMYLTSRTCIEITANINRIILALHQIKNEQSLDWETKGKNFFNALVRSRHGSYDPFYLEYTKKIGISNKNSKPFNVNENIKHLQQAHPETEFTGCYNRYSDVIHQNAIANLAGMSSSRVGNCAEHKSGGKIVLPHESLLVTYTYPSQTRVSIAKEETLALVTECVRLSLKYLSNMPETPFNSKPKFGQKNAI